MKDILHYISNQKIIRYEIFRRYGTIIALLALIAFNVLVTPNFISWQTLNVNLTQVAGIIIVATGMTLVIATGGVDLSVGSLMAIAGALAPIIFMGKWVEISDPTASVLLAIFIPILTAGIFGLFNGYLITRFSIQPIIATLVLFIAGRGIAQVVTNGNLQVFRNPQFQIIGLGRIAGIPVQVIIMIIIVMMAGFIVHKTVWGHRILSVGGNEKAALLSGIPVTKVKLLVYFLSGICSGVAGLVVIAINSSSDANLVGLGMELDAIAAAAVGGTLLSGGRAYIGGTFIGALIIQLVRYTLLANGVPDAAALVVKAGLIIFAVWLQGGMRR
jgi:ribose transport system permease protein